MTVMTTLQREQIDHHLADIACRARQRYRANPDDPVLSRDVVAHTRQLLRLAAIDHHLHICDTAQHLLLELGGDAEEGEDADQADRDSPIPVHDADLIRVVQLVDGPAVADVGLQLVDDPFDLDAYAPGDESEADPGTGPDATPEVANPGDAPASERRHSEAAIEEAELRRGLSSPQLATLDTMSHFGWSLRFVRRPMFLPPMPVAFDRNRQRFVVVEPDGSVNEEPGLNIRDGAATRGV